MKLLQRTLPALALVCCLLLSGCTFPQGSGTKLSLEDVPAYSGEPYVEINGNEPDFPSSDLTEEAFETYSSLDALGRCGTAYANVGVELMPTEDRGDIGQVKPSGWHTVKYDCVDGKYLYNRCHLIGYQLTGENANEENLITGTRYLNVEGMLPFENMVADYVQETENHVLYRVTPIYEGSDLVTRGVQMEALSVEDRGAGICFNVYVYNVQPGVTIDYATGESWLEDETPEMSGSTSETGQSQEPESTQEAQDTQTESGEEESYVLNTSSHKFHLPTCSSVESIKEDNRQDYTGTREDLIAQGYSPCGQCKS